MQNKLTLLDLIDINFLQKLQDSFAKTMGIASLTIDENGIITKPSNFTDFCINHIRASELGAKRCSKCEIDGWKLALEKCEPVIYTCHIGFTHFVVPIIVAGQPIAAILGGQIALSKPDKDHFKNIAQELGIKDEKKYLKALEEVKIIPEEKIKLVIQLLSLVTNLLSEIACKNYLLMENSKRETVLRNIIDKIRSSLDINVIQYEIVSQIGKLFDADGVRIADYDYELQDYTVKKEAEYTSSNDIKSMVGVKFKNIQGFEEYIRDVHLSGKDIIFSDLETYLDEKKIRGTEVEAFYREFGFISSAAVNISYGDKYLGDFVLTFNYQRNFSEEEINFLKTLADQAGVAFCQSKLHKTTVEQTERETLLREITKTIRETLDLNETKKTIVTQIGKALDADRVFIVEFDPETNIPQILDENSEFKSKNLESLIGYDFASTEVEFFANIYKQKQPVVMPNIEDFVIEHNLQNTDVEKWTRRIGAKTGIGIPMVYGKKNFGVLCVIYTTSVHSVTDEYVDFIKAISDQAGIALYQAELHSITKKQAERERVLRLITNKIRSSLSFENIKKEIVNQIGKLFSVDRVVVAHYDYKINNYIITNDSEYRSRDDVKTFVDIDFANIPGFSEYVRDTHFKGKDIIFNNLEDYLEQNNFKNTRVEDFYREFGFISSAAINIYYKNIFLGDLVLTYENPRDFSKEEIDFLKAVADQIGVAFHQAELYENAKKTAERETILRKIIETVRSSLDLNEVKQKVVNEIGRAFKADRCYFRTYDKLKEWVSKPQVEYLSSSEIKSMLNIESDQKSFKYFIDEVEKRKKRFYPLVVNEDFPKTPEHEAYAKTFGILADYAIPIVDRQEDLLWLVLHYVEQDPKLGEEDLNLLETIAYQVDIAFEQIALYNSEKKTAEREALLRKIISTIRTSLNLEETFNIICSEIAKISGANRVTILEMVEKYDKEIVRGEFKTGENIKGVNDIKFGRASIFEYLATSIFAENEPLVLANIEESDTPVFVKEFYRSLDVKSLTVFPIRKEKDEWGILTISYVDEYRSLNEHEIKLLKTIIEQIYIAIKQAELYDKTRLMAKREALVRSITEKIRSSLNIDETLTYICEETAKLFNVQRSTIVVYPDKKDYTVYELKKEYKLLTNIKGYASIIDLNKIAEYWGRMLTTTDKVIAIDNLMESDAPDYFKDAYAEMGVKSIIGTIISNNNVIWGVLILSEYTQYRMWSDEEKDLLGTISQQIYIAINQAELYEKEKIMLERERISRNIIEILRSSIDKKIIKKLFVKNIGKFFNADRVFFSEYDSDKNIYLPVDNNSEYLSNISEKSFIGYDWSNPEIKDHIQPLLDRREIKIVDWDEYIKQHPNLSTGFRALYEDSGVKSSYNFPVLYQDNIIGYFCLEFTQNVCNITDEDIGRIRSICTQAGIAIHHAELYLQAQECLYSRKSFVSDFLTKVKNPTNNILDSSMLLYQNEFERPMQIEYLNNIISSCNQLLELTKNSEVQDE